MESRKLASGLGERVERRERDARQLLCQIVGEVLPVARCMQYAVDVVEDGVLGDGAVAVVDAELAQGSVGDVVDALNPRLEARELTLSVCRAADTDTVESTGRPLRGS